MVRLLYQGCTGTIREARRHLAAGDIAARSRAISKAWGILAELAGALDLERGGEIGLRLGTLYEYMQHRLLEANFEQSDALLREVLGLVATLAEAWDGVAQAASPQAASSAGPWSQMPPDTPHVAQAWSF